MPSTARPSGKAHRCLLRGLQHLRPTTTQATFSPTDRFWSPRDRRAVSRRGPSGVCYSLSKRRTDGASSPRRPRANQECGLALLRDGRTDEPGSTLAKCQAVWLANESGTSAGVRALCFIGD